jgi:ribosomal protein S6
MPKVKLQVVLENVDLSKAQIAALQKEINGVVASKLLKAKIAAAAAPGIPQLAYRIPKEWLGIWIKTIKLPTDIVKFGGKDLAKFPGLK